MNTVNPVKSLNLTREPYDSMEKRLFERGLNEKNKSQKLRSLENHMEKFEVIKRKNDASVKKILEEEEEKRKKELAKVHNEFYDEFGKVRSFAKEWNKKGEETWEKNMKTMNERQRNDKEFDFKIESKKKNKLQKIQELTRSEVLDGISKFENKLSLNVGASLNLQNKELSGIASKHLLAI